MHSSGVRLRTIWVVNMVAFFLMLTLSSASAFEYGKLKRDRETTHIFQKYEVVPNHTYYICGEGNIPYAIIGIHNNYTLRKGLWKQVDISPQLLRGWLGQMDTIYGFQPYGSKILDNHGGQVGIWFSSKQWTTVVLEENNGIAVFTPEPPGFRGGK